MKNIKIRFFILCLCLSVTGYTSASARTEKVKTDIDWPAFMQKQDLIWEILPEYWYESAYMGNGMLGLMIYKEPGQNYIRLKPATARYTTTKRDRTYLPFPDCSPGTSPYILKV